jgi:hypothetical protein
MAFSVTTLSQAPTSNAGAPGGKPPAVAVDTSVYPSYAGHYKISDAAVLTVSQDGPRLLGQMTGQGPFELSARSKTEYFVRQFNVYFTFTTDAQGRVTALNLYHEGIGSAALPIDAQLASQIEQHGRQLQKEANARLASKSPMPGSETALRRLFAGLLEGKPNYDEMSPQFADVTRRQVVQLQQGAQALGAITSLTFLSPAVQGGDAYQVNHQHGASFIQIALSSDGKIQGALFVASPPAVADTAKAAKGPYQPTREMAFGAPGLKVFRPEGIDRISRNNRLPVVIWGAGGCAFDGPIYTGLLSTIASHGFLVITTAGRAQEGFGDRQSIVDDLTSAIDWAERENVRIGSPLNGKIETKRIAAIGQSCGGGLAIELGADPRVATIAVFNYGTTGEALKKLHGPVLLVNGHESDFMMGASKATYDEIDNLPVFYGALRGVGHTGTVIEPGGGEFANVASNWFLWQLKDDKSAAAMFVGQKCGLCTDPHWEVGSKRTEN